MAFRAGKGIIDLAVNTKPLRGAAGAVRGAMRGLGGVALAGLAAATAGFVALGFAMKGALQASAIQEKAEAKLKAVLVATGNAAGFSADQLFEQARQMQANTTIGDEMIINMQAVVATFKNIRGDVFVSATSAIADMAAVLDTDLKSASISVGKALNDPVTGITALSRVGVTFSQQQKDLIKTLVQTGDVMGAQRIILAELNSEFGGAAAAQAKTFSGSIIQLKNSIGDLMEEIGKSIEPILKPFVQKLKELIPEIRGALIPAIKSLISGMKGLFNWIEFVISGWGDFNDIITLSISLMRNFGNVSTIVIATTAKLYISLFKSVSGGFIKIGAGILDFASKFDFLDLGIKKVADSFKAFDLGANIAIAGLESLITKAKGGILADSLANAVSSGIEKGAKDSKDAFDPMLDKVNAAFGVGGGGGKGKSIAGRFEGLDSMFKRIQSSAFKTKDPAVLTNTLLKENNKLTRENIAVQRAGLANLGIPQTQVG